MVTAAGRLLSHQSLPERAARRRVCLCVRASVHACVGEWEQVTRAQEQRTRASATGTSQARNLTRTQLEQRAFELTRVDDERSSPVTLDLQSQRLELGAGEQGVIVVKLTVKTACPPLALCGAGAGQGKGKDSNETPACVKIKLAVTALAPGGCGVLPEPVPDLVELLVRLAK